MMSRSMYDHFKVRNAEDHGADLHFNPRVLGDNIPLRGYPPNLKEEEWDDIETRPVGKVKTFDLSKQDHLDEYTVIVHRAINGWYKVIHSEHHFDEATKVMWVHVEWAQLYHEVPDHLRILVDERNRQNVSPK
jgi:hypothetical protein